jgi:hypothetical protein
MRRRGRCRSRLMRVHVAVGDARSASTRSASVDVGNAERRMARTPTGSAGVAARTAMDMVRWEKDSLGSGHSLVSGLGYSVVAAGHHAIPTSYCGGNNRDIMEGKQSMYIIWVGDGGRTSIAA